jgi:hypothetical protein
MIMNDTLAAPMSIPMSETAESAVSPFALIVNPAVIKAAADRIAQLGLPRLVVKAFSEKEKSEPTPRARRAAQPVLKPR